jgi:hypothetical protein
MAKVRSPVKSYTIFGGQTGIGAVFSDYSISNPNPHSTNWLSFINQM